MNTSNPCDLGRFAYNIHHGYDLDACWGKHVDADQMWHWEYLAKAVVSKELEDRIESVV